MKHKHFSFVVYSLPVNVFFLFWISGFKYLVHVMLCFIV